MADKLKQFVRETIDQMLASLPAEVRLKGLPADVRLKGLPAEVQIRALSPEALEVLIRQLRINGSSTNEN